MLCGMRYTFESDFLNLVNRIMKEKYILTRLEDFSNQLNLRRVKRRVAALFLAQMTPPTPTSAHFEAPMAMLPALGHFFSIL